MKVRATKIETPIGEMTIGRFEVCWNIGRLQLVNFKYNIVNLSFTIPGSVYQAPQRRFAIGFHQPQHNVTLL